MLITLSFLSNIRGLIKESVLNLALFLIQALITDFEVSEGIYSRASIEDTDSVCLWLGANVMLEYSCEEVCHFLY